MAGRHENTIARVMEFCGDSDLIDRTFDIMDESTTRTPRDGMVLDRFAPGLAAARAFSTVLFISSDRGIRRFGWRNLGCTISATAQTDAHRGGGCSRGNVHATEYRLREERQE